MTTLLSARDIRRLAEVLDLRPTKTRGQNFVIDPNTVRMIVSAADLPENSVVAEVGPGLGSLTLGLLEAGHEVVAVEIDDALAGLLPDTVAERAGDDAPFSLVHADAMRVTELPREPTALVANLPYNVAVPVLLHFLSTFPSIEQVLVMVQAEVADRLAAGPGSRTYGVPSAKAQWYGEVTRAATIGKNVFWPAPNIDSGLVKIVRRPAPVDDVDRADVFTAVDAAFSQRRKGLRSALAAWAGGRPQADAILERAGIMPTTRGEALDITGFAALARAKAELAGELAGTELSENATRGEG